MSFTSKKRKVALAGFSEKLVEPDVPLKIGLFSIGLEPATFYTSR